MTRIAHLVDDTNPGGVTRYLDFLATHPAMRFARHEVVSVARNRAGGARVEADVIVSHLAMTWRGLPGLTALRARYPGTPLVHVEHSYSEGFVAANVSARARFMTLLRATYALFDRVVAVSSIQGAWMVRRGLVAPDALSVISPCVDLAPFRALTAPTGPSQVIGALGRFHEQKGFDLLIRAFRSIDDPDMRLRMIGDGPERPALERLAAGDDRITIARFAADPAVALAEVDAVAMPSRWEPYGLVALEARAAGRRVLAARVDGLEDHTAAGAIGVLSPTVEAWSGALRSLASPPAVPDRATGAEHRTAELWCDLLQAVGDGRAGRREAA